MSEAGELYYACSLANMKIQGALCPYIRSLGFSNPIAERITNFFLEESHLGQPYRPVELKGFLLSLNLVEAEILSIMAQCNEFFFLENEENTIRTILLGFQTFYQTRKIVDVGTQYRDDPQKFIKGIAEIQAISFSPIPVEKLSSLDLQAVIQADLGGVNDILPTSFEFIKKAMPFGGHLRGQLGLVVARTGAGKSLFLAQEVLEMLRQGKHVYWIALGDMLRVDFFARFAAMEKQVSLTEAYLNLNYYWDDHMRDLTKSLRFTVVPSSSVDVLSVRHLIETSISHEQNPDCIIVDYDSNFAKQGGEEVMMYLEGGELYDILSSIARPSGRQHRLVLVASQPKLVYWDSEEIPLEGAGESSRKQHIVDFMITIGVCPFIRKQVSGIMKLVKARRGNLEGADIRYIRNSSGLFVPISVEEYLTLKTFDGGFSNKTRKPWTPK